MQKMRGSMGRVSQDQAAKNREAVVASASGLIRQKGVDGVGVRELMAAAGLTQGALAGQFATKEALVAEACAHAFAAAERALSAASEGDRPGRARRIAEYYLVPKPPELSCPMSTLAADASRSPPGSMLRRAFTDGLARIARVVSGDSRSPDRLAFLAAIVGAMVLQRAGEDDALAEEIKQAVIALGRSVA